MLWIYILYDFSVLRVKIHNNIISLLSRWLDLLIINYSVSKKRVYVDLQF